MSAANIHFFFQLRDQIHLYHWQTKSFSRHKATDDVIAALLTSIDQFVETYMGKYGRPRLTPKTATFHLSNLSESGIIKYVRSAIKYVSGDLVTGLRPGVDMDLFNLRDEMLGELNKLLYLFTLR